MQKTIIKMWMLLIATVFLMQNLNAEDKKKEADLDVLMKTSPSLEQINLMNLPWQIDAKKAPKNLQEILSIMEEDSDSKGFSWLEKNILSITLAEKDSKLLDDLYIFGDNEYKRSPDTTKKLNLWMKENEDSFKDLLNAQINLSSCRSSGSLSSLTADGFLKQARLFLFASEASGNPKIFSENASLIIKSIQSIERCLASSINSTLSIALQSNVFHLTAFLAKEGKLPLSNIKPILSAYGTNKDLKQRIKRSIVGVFWFQIYSFIKFMEPTAREMEQNIQTSFPELKTPLFDKDWVLTQYGTCVSGLIEEVDTKSAKNYACKSFELSKSTESLLSEKQSWWCRIKQNIFKSNSCTTEKFIRANELEPPILSRLFLKFPTVNFEHFIKNLRDDADKLTSCVDSLKTLTSLDPDKAQKLNACLDL